MPEEQQRFNGVLGEVPGSGGDDFPESGNKNNPSTPAPTFESPFQDKAVKDQTSAKSLCMDEPFSRHEPLTPDSRGNVVSPAESPKDERSMKKQRVSIGATYTKPDLVLTHQILDLSLNS